MTQYTRRLAQQFEQWAKDKGLLDENGDPVVPNSGGTEEE